MSYDFNAADILEMAEQMERNGAAFYRDAAEKVGDEAAKTFLLELAGMEDEHEKTFATIKADLSEGEQATTAFDPAGESAQYLKSLADIRVFYKKEINTDSMPDILKAAIDAEKDSIVFYLGMKDMVPEKLGKNRVDAIIKEEMGHVRLLSRKLLATKK